MTEKELQLLGFEKETGDSFYYYTYKFCRGISFISNASDELFEGEWYIEFTETPTVRFTKFEEFQALLNLLNKRKI